MENAYVEYKSNLKGLKVNFHLLRSFARLDWFLYWTRSTSNYQYYRKPMIKQDLS